VCSRLDAANDFRHFTSSFQLRKSLGFIQPLTEMGTRDRNKKKNLVNRAWRVREAGNHTVIREPIV
jgi:hypothetical protein